ncbi:hypothetical protein Pelo_10288 [Pelomyxa schiedti]|nr:hypothetical protein Pelo_10288 [Pelomyxa schiedti]
MGALILELFYRFVWGRYTFFRYKQQTSASTPPHSGENGENSPAVQAVPEPDIKLRYVSEDVIESGDLGMGHDAEEETDENDNSDDETDDNEEESTPAQTPVIAEASLMESEQVEIYEGETKSDDIPGRASLFFSHASITSTIDEIEADLFEEMERNTTIPFFSGSWNISKVLTAFSRLAIDRAVHKGDAIHTLPETKKAILHQYSKYCKWLQNLGICTSGEDNCVWTWAHGVLEFVDTMYTLIFKNLTSNGTRVNLQMFSRLFPRISMIQDPRADARLPEICTTIEQALKSTGKVSDELSSVVTLLNGLMEERKTLNAHLSEDISTLTGIHKLLRENQRKRLQQVNEEIEAAREEFHRLTANVDLKPSVKVPRYSLNLHGVHVSHHYTRTKQSHGREIGNSIIISSFTQKSMFMMRRCQYGERGAFSYCALWEGDFCKEFYDFCMPFTLSAPSPQQFFLEVNSFCCRMGVKPPTKPSPSPSSNSTPSVPADQLSTPNPKESSAGTLCPSKTPKAEASFICTELTTGKMYIACTAGHILNTALRTEAKTRPPFQIKPTPLDCLCDRVSEVECGDEALIVVLGSAAFWRAGTVLCPQSSSPSTTNPPGTRNPASYVGAIAQAVPPPDSCWAFTQMQQVNSPITTTNSTTPSASASATTTATATANSNITTNTSASANTAGTATAARAKSSNCVAKKCGLPNWVASNQLDESQTNGEVVFAVLRLAPGAQAFSDKAALEISNVSLGTTVTENGSDTTTTTKSTATSEKRSTTKKPEKKKHTSTQQHYNDKS